MRFLNIKTISGVAGVGVIVLLGFFMFFRSEEVLPDDIRGSNFPQTQNNKQYNSKNKEFSVTQNNYSSQVGFEDLFLPVVRPLEPAVSYITGVFSGGSGENNNNTEDIKSVGVETEHGSTSKPVLSEKQIFDILWPESYRDALIMLQDLMVKDGFMSESEKVSHMTSDDHIYITLLKIADYAVKQEWVESADFDRLRRGIQELEHTVSAERVNLRTNGKISNGVLLPGGQRINKTPVTKKDFFSMVIDGLKYSLTTHSANAQISGVPGWHTTPDCYKDLAPTYWVPGPNLWAFCCNCGLDEFGVFVEDCGPFSVLCVVPLGCLNLMCIDWPNAIWDAFWNPLGTGICGCG